MPGLLPRNRSGRSHRWYRHPVSGRVQRRHAERLVDRYAQMAAERNAAYQQHYAAQQRAAPAPQGGTDVISQLKELGALRDQGILTDDEFAAQKKILNA